MIMLKYQKFIIILIKYIFENIARNISCKNIKILT